MLAAGFIALVIASCGGGEPERGPLFGFNSALSLWALEPADEVRLERLAGADAQRYGAEWRYLQPRRSDPPLTKSPGLERLDALYRELVDNEMTPIVIPGNAPPWAAGRAAGPNWMPPDREHVADWQRFVAALAERYPQAVIEPWNEPNYQPFWQGAPLDPALMARLQCAAFRAVPRNRTVLSTGFAVRAGFSEYLADFERHGGGRCFDALSVHIYRGAKVPGRDDVWITETGVSSVPGRISEKQQAERIVRLYDRFTKMKNVRAVLFNTLRDAQDPPLLPRRGSRDYHYGFLRVDLSPKPVYCAFARRERERPRGC